MWIYLFVFLGPTIYNRFENRFESRFGNQFGNRLKLVWNCFETYLDWAGYICTVNCMVGCTVDSYNQFIQIDSWWWNKVCECSLDTSCSWMEDRNCNSDLET